MKIKQLFVYQQVREERKVSLPTLSLQGYVIYRWTSFERDTPLQYLPI